MITKEVICERVSYQDRVKIQTLVRLWDWSHPKNYCTRADLHKEVEEIIDRLRSYEPDFAYDFWEAMDCVGDRILIFVDHLYNLPLRTLHRIDPEFGWQDRFDRLVGIYVPYPYLEHHYPSIPWRFREQYRMRYVYDHVPWENDLPEIPDHYVHMSKKQPGMVAFTPDDDKGRRDIQVMVRPGRYLTKFYPHLSSEEVRKWATMIDGALELKFAKTADEIINVYLNGPRSCMAYDLDNYSSHVHPVSVYGDSDVQVAYLADHTGRVTDRAVVWPEKKIYGRVYGGNDGRLIRKLEEAGYRSGSLKGARIRRINEPSEPDCLVMPYIDGCQSFDVIDEHWCQIGGPYAADRTDGLGYMEEPCICHSCDARLPEEEVYTWEGEHYCRSCIDEFTFVCDRCGEREADDCGVTVNTSAHGSYLNTATWCEHCANNHSFYCEGADESFSYRHFHEVELEDGRIWSDWYFEQHGITVDGKHYEIGQEPKEEDEDEYSNGISGADQGLAVETSN